MSVFTLTPKIQAGTVQIYSQTHSLKKMSTDAIGRGDNQGLDKLQG
jgi:hypothetical protein